VLVWLKNLSIALAEKSIWYWVVLWLSSPLDGKKEFSVWPEDLWRVKKNTMFEKKKKALAKIRK